MSPSVGMPNKEAVVYIPAPPSLCNFRDGFSPTRQSCADALRILLYNICSFRDRLARRTNGRVDAPGTLLHGICAIDLSVGQLAMMVSQPPNVAGNSMFALFAAGKEVMRIIEQAWKQLVERLEHRCLTSRRLTLFVVPVRGRSPFRPFPLLFF